MNILERQTVRILFSVIMFACSTFNIMAQHAKVDYGRLITAIGTVESKLNDKAVNGVHAGFLQISKVAVAEANRINTIRKIKKRYTPNDRFNHQKSIEIFNIIQSYYNPKGDLHYAILLWNEGCSAMDKPKRKTNYYNKVMKVYNGLKR